MGGEDDRLGRGGEERAEGRSKQQSRGKKNFRGSQRRRKEQEREREMTGNSRTHRQEVEEKKGRERDRSF